MPTLVLHGAADELVPSANAVQLARLLPESRLHILSGEGHLLVFDPQGGALPLLEDFFGSARLGDSRAWATGKPGRAQIELLRNVYLIRYKVSSFVPYPSASIFFLIKARDSENVCRTGIHNPSASPFFRLSKGKITNHFALCPDNVRTSSAAS